MQRPVPPASGIAPATRAEAAAWVAKLHGPGRDACVEAGLHDWLNAHPLHQAAFEQATDSWESVGVVPAERLSAMVRWDRVGGVRARSRHYLPLSIAATLVLLFGTTIWFTTARDAYATQAGEQRTVVLSDGSRIHLNTATSIKVRFDKQRRRVELKEGEALFEVAHAPSRPFEVIAGTRAITALGTSFVVRRDPGQFSVTLVEGKVAVEDADEAGRTILLPGDRITLARAASTIDNPPLERILAWQHGLVMLDAVPLRAAIEEMNRYGKLKIVFRSQLIDSQAPRISGAFRTGDAESFAQALATTYGLALRRDVDNVVLEGLPHRTY